MERVEGRSDVGQLVKRGKRKKREMVPLRDDQIKKITKIDQATGKEKVIEEISLLDSDDEGEQYAREAEAKETIEVLDLFQKDDAGRKYYRRFSVNGCVYGLGDTVMLNSGEERGNFVGIIESIFQLKTILPIKKEGAKQQLAKPRKKAKFKVKVRWFYRKFDIDDRRRDYKIPLPRKGFPGVATVNEEVYWAFEQDINDMTSVLCPARIIYCPAATDPQQMAAICQKEPNTFFCRYIYYNMRFYHINNFAEDWGSEDERHFEVRGLFLRLLQEGVEFPSLSESESEDSDFDADADSCTPEPLEESVADATAMKRKPSLATMFVEVKRETQPAQKVPSSRSDVDSDDRRDSMNGATYILDSDTPLDDEDDEAEADEEEAVMEEEEQEEEEMKDGDDIENNFATNKRKRTAEKGKEKITDNGKRRKSADAGMLADDEVRLESIVRSSPARATSGSQSSPTSSSSSSSSPSLTSASSSSLTPSLGVKQKLVKAAKADMKRRKSLEEQALKEAEERREVNRRRQQNLDDEMKRLSLRPREKSSGKSVLIETPDFLPLETDATPIPPRLRRRRASQQKDADASGEKIEISFHKKATAGATTTPASVAASDNEDAPLDLSENDSSADAGGGGGDGWGGDWDTPAASGAKSASDAGDWGSWGDDKPTGTADKTNEPSGDGTGTGTSTSGSDWGSSWGDDEPTAAGSSSSASGGDGWGSSWGDNEPTAAESSSSAGGSGGWADDWNDVPSTQPASSSAGGGITSWAGLSATNSTEESSNRWADAGGGRSEHGGGRGGGGGGGVCYKCNKPGHFARECTEAGSSASGPLPEIGSTCPAKVMSVGKKDGRAFGVFVRPDGCCQDGLVHFTRMLRRRVEPDDEDLLELVGGVGATVNVKVLDIEEENGKRRLKLSMKDADQQPPNVDASGGGGGTCFKCGKSGHFARECPGVVSSEQGFGGSAGGGHGSDATASHAWDSAGSINQHGSNNGASGGTGFSFMHPDRLRALGLAPSPASTSAPPLSPSAASAPPASNFPGAVGGSGYPPPAYDQQPQQLHQFQQPQQQYQPHITFVMPPAYAQPAPQPHVAGYQPPQGHNIGWAGRNSIPAPPQPQPQPHASASASSASAAPSSLLAPTLTEEEEAELATVPYDLTTLNQARLGRMTMMRWFKRYRRRFNVTFLVGLLVRVVLNRQGYVGEIVSVVRSDPYYLTSGYELAIPPEDPAQLAQALNERTLIRVTFKLMVEIPGVDEGREFPAYAISSNYFSHQEMVQWLLGRKAMGRAPLTREEIEAKKRTIAKARAKSNINAAADQHRKNSLDLSAPPLGQAVSQDKGKEKEQGEEENGGAAILMGSSSSDAEPLTALTTSTTLM